MPETQAVEQEVQATPVEALETPVETEIEASEASEAEQQEASTLTVEELNAQLVAERAKTARAVAAEKTRKPNVRR